VKELKGTVALIPTPLTDDGKIDEKGLPNLIDYDFDNGCSAVAAAAAIGEGYFLRPEDVETIVRTSADAVNSRAPPIVGCPGMDTIEAVDFCKKAQSYGTDAILAFNPKYKGFDAV
jgi:4-hydroxy-tetrahydrodipicolinate synthase